MIATKDELFDLSEGELAKLMRSGVVVNAAFGPGWVALRWDKGEELPDCVRELARLRGVGTEGIEGEGI